MSGGLTSWRRVLSVVLAVGATAALPSSAGAVSFFRDDFPVDSHPTSVAVGNFNGGALDLAIANEGYDNIAIRLGNGSGVFSGTGTVATGTNSDPRAIAAGDFNDDGKTDLVAANQGSSTVSIHLGDGMGGFSADPTPCVSLCTAAENPVAIAVGRFDDIPAGTPDPTLDVIVASQTDDQALVLFGDGTGEINGSQTTYTMATSMANPNPSGLAIGSLNPTANAEPDLLVANQGPDQVWPGFGTVGGGGFGFGGVLATGADPVAVAFGDLDGDGDDDGISADSGGGTATTILSDGGGGTAVDSSTPVGSSPRAVTTGGFDADAKADVVVANYDSNSVTILSSLAPGPPATPPPGITSPPASKKKKCKKKKRRAAAAKKKKCKRKKR